MPPCGCLTERARAVITLLTLGAIGLAALRVPAPATAPPLPAGKGDVATFQAVVARLRTGAPYYPTYGFELRRAGYPTRDAFNWRTPLLLSAVSSVPKGVPEAIGIVVVFAFLLALCRALATMRQHSTAVWLASMMQVGAVAILAAPSVVVLGEAWAGVLVGFSVCAFARQRPVFAVPLGLLALFVRELAAPYCVVCTVIAAFNRRWQEVGAWIGGACVYAAYFGWHLTQVWAHRLPTDLAHDSSWLEFGGLPFLLTTVHRQAWLRLLPAPLTALALVLIVAGIADARAPRHVRAASAVYVLFFLVAGKPFNSYWGLMAWPTWALACGYGVDTTGRAIRTAFAPRGLSALSRSDGENRRCVPFGISEKRR